MSELREERASSRNYRLWFLATCFLVGFALLCGRLYQLQHLQQAKLAQHANRQHSFSEVIPARPGEILDRNGKVLATTITTHSLYVDPSKIEDIGAIAETLCTVIELDPADLRKRLEKHKTKRFLWIKRRLPNEQANAIVSLGLPQETWGFRNEYLRSYPQGKLAAHLLGLRNIDGVGRGGVEEYFDETLQGTPGSRTLFRDARGKVFLQNESDFEPPQQGKSLVLTLDMVIQFYVEQELNKLVQEWHPKSCCAIVLDPHTGEIIAMASRPTFDPNYPEEVIDSAWKNCAISAIYEPGSTFKPLVVAGAVDRMLIAPEEIIHCEQGAYKMGRRTLHDHHSYGELSLTDVLVKSSNIGMAKIGERLQNRELFQTVVDFGFGRKTGLPVPGELSGQVRPFKKWDHYSTGSIPMGQEIATTPLQMILAHGVLANGGYYLSPQLVKEALDFPWLARADNTTVSRELTMSINSALPHNLPVPVKAKVLSKETADWVVSKPMAEVITRGTGKRAKIEEYNLFGKTGTAQKVDPVTGKYSKLKNISSFICGGPVENPRLLVFVLADEPGSEKNAYGGQAAAPVAARIIKAALSHLQVPANE